jgi:excisionase family DNA binding protein
VLNVQEIRKAGQLVQQLRAQRDEENAALVQRLLDQALAVSGGSQVAAGQFMTTGQAARALGVAIQTIKNWVAAGDLTGVKVGRRTLVRREDILAYLERLAAARPQPAPAATEAATRQHHSVLAALPAEKVARYEELADRRFDEQPLTEAEQAELAALSDGLTRLATKRLSEHERRRRSARH